MVDRGGLLGNESDGGRLLVQGGVLVDPASGWNGPADLMFEDGRVAAVGRELRPPPGAQVLDARGRLVLPGLVDTHVHLGAGYWPGHVMMARAGVTTALNLSGSVTDVLDGIRAAGAGLTIATLESVAPGRGLSGVDPTVGEIRDAVERRIEAGALGVKVLGGHYPFTPAATGEIFRALTDQHAYAAFHVGTTAHGSNLDGLREAEQLAGGRPLHIAHVNSYCRGTIAHPIDEAREAIEILSRSPHLRSESYLALINGTSGRCVDGAPASQATRNCLASRGYPATEAGLERALLDGYAMVNDAVGDENALLRGEAARHRWRERETDVSLSFPVNDPTSQFILATARHADGRFAVDALATDGGGIPRNVTLARGMALVALDALSLEELVRKACLTPARMLGLQRKGHLGVGADADAAIVDPRTGSVRVTIARGRPIVVDGIVLGSGGTVVTTDRGAAAIREAGMPYEVVDLARSAFYEPALLGDQPPTSADG